MRKLIMLALLAAGTAALVALPAAAKPRGTNGKIVVNVENAVTGQEQVYTINPDGTDLQFLANDQEAGQWSPDGTKIAMFGGYLDFDTGDITDLGLPFDRYPDLALFCGVWSPNGARLACEGFGQTDGSLNGVYTIRSSDGGDLQRVTTAEFDDCPADYSPHGNEILFSAHVPDTDRSTIWTVHSDGSGLRKIPVLGCGGPVSDPTSIGCQKPVWSPDGRKIMFERHFLIPNDHFDLYTVNADGSGLFQVTNTPDLNEGGGDWGTHPVTP